jgi:hypothetical protein
MQKKIFLSLILTLLTLSNVMGQIVGSEDEKVDKKVEQGKIDRANRTELRAVDSVTQLFFNANWSVTYRELTPNGELFGKELGTRTNEKSANFWSYSLGMRNALSDHFQVEVGLGFTRNGEQYSFDEPDTSYYYKTTYRFISMPIVAYYTYGKDIKFFGGIGVMPQLFMSELQELKWTTKNNTKVTDEIKTKSGSAKHASFTSSALLRCGIQLNYSRYWSIYVMPEYRVQLSSTYGKNSPYIHKGNAIGLNIGFTYQL